MIKTMYQSLMMFTLTSALLGVKLVAAEGVYDCEPHKEFIATFNYLRQSNSTAAMPVQERTDLAFRVAKGCHGAAARFIKVNDFLVNALLAPQHALEVAESFVHRTESETDAFVTIFKAAYATDMLDLNVYNSLKLAKSLAQEFSLAPEWVAADFFELARFCVSEHYWDLPKAKCASFVGDLVRETASKTQNGVPLPRGVVKPLNAALDFLSEQEQGPKLAFYDALALAETLIKTSPFAVDAFIASYRFAQSSKGLQLNRTQAIDLARKVALQTAYQAPAEAKKQSMADNRGLFPDVTIQK